MATHSRTPRLAASLIVRDEEARIGACLDALRDVVDEIHVHDTGSSDATAARAAAHGARVTHGPWTDDFAAARNAALQGWTADWVLSVDADEIVVADAAGLRRLIATTTADVLNIAQVNRASDGSAAVNMTSRLFRPAIARWRGRIHEQLVGSQRDVVRDDVDPAILHFDHDGYATADIRQAKGARNAQLARAALADFARQGDDADPVLVARTMLHLGRSLQGAGELQQAVETYEAVRELFGGTPHWNEATDHLARLVLDHGMGDVALTLVVQLRGAGASRTYCDWLEATCLGRMGHLTTARQLLDGLTDVVDLKGRQRDPAELAGLRDEIDTLLRSGSPSAARA